MDDEVCRNDACRTTGRDRPDDGSGRDVPRGGDAMNDPRLPVVRLMLRG